VSKILEVRTDLPSINPHDHLDYILKFQPYLEFILLGFNGYISQTNFFYYMNDRFNKTESQTKTILQKLIKNNWIGQENIGNRHKILFLKRKARVCLHEDNLSDLPKPTNRTIIRTLLLEHYSIDKYVAEYHRNVYSVKTGFDPNDILLAKLLFEGDIQILFLDITRKTGKQYAEFMRSFTEDDRFEGNNIHITFIAYTESRKKTLLKIFEDAYVKNLKASLYKPERLNIEVQHYNLLPYFDNKEPLL
jgi:hypothetical protein